jgi:hypothetical protein
MGGKGWEEKPFENYSWNLRTNPLFTQNMAITGVNRTRDSMSS